MSSQAKKSKPAVQMHRLSIVSKSAIAKLTAPACRELLNMSGASKDGNKAQLVERLGLLCELPSPRPTPREFEDFNDLQCLRFLQQHAQTLSASAEERRDNAIAYTTAMWGDEFAVPPTPPTHDSPWRSASEFEAAVRRASVRKARENEARLRHLANTLNTPRPCANPTCDRPAENALCRKTGALKSACSQQCYYLYKAGTVSSALHTPAPPVNDTANDDFINEISAMSLVQLRQLLHDLGLPSLQVQNMNRDQALSQLRATLGDDNDVTRNSNDQELLQARQDVIRQAIAAASAGKRNLSSELDLTLSGSSPSMKGVELQLAVTESLDNDADELITCTDGSALEQQLAALRRRKAQLQNSQHTIGVERKRQDLLVSIAKEQAHIASLESDMQQSTVSSINVADRMPAPAIMVDGTFGETMAGKRRVRDDGCSTGSGGGGVDTLAAAIDKLIGSRTGSDGNDEHSRESARLKKTKSEDVVPRFGTSAQAFGAQIGKAAFGWIDAHAGWQHSMYSTSVDDKKSKILKEVRADTSKGISSFLTLLYEQIQRAATDTTGALTSAGVVDSAIMSSRQAKRGAQTIAITVEWPKFLLRAENMAAAYDEGDDTKDLQVELCIREAFELQMPLAEMTLLRKHKKMRANSDGGSCVGGREEQLLQSIQAIVHTSGQRHEYGGRREELSTGNGGNGGLFKPSGDRPNETSHMPTAKAIVGASTPRSILKSKARCTVLDCPDPIGHSPLECPKAFAYKFRDKGKTIPGFDTMGARKPGMWRGDNINDSCRLQWISMIRMGYFTLPLNRGAPFPDFGSGEGGN